jgi:radical SAM superfamily enzyme YgiQ (UPF0313 family)
MAGKQIAVNIFNPDTVLSPKKRIIFFSFGKYISPPLGLGYLVSYLKKSGFNIDVQYLENLNDIEEATSRILVLNPDIIALTSPSVHFNQIKALCKSLKMKRDIPIFLGGSHITSLPDSLPTDVDVGFIGESEETIVEIMQLVCINSFKKHSLANVKGIVYYDDTGQIKITEKREAIKNLDLIPFADRTIFPKEYLESKSTQILTSRSCPYHCVFCQAIPQHFTYRFHSAEYVVNEISELHYIYGFTEFGINDELFAANKPRIKKIIELLKEKGLLGKLKFAVNGRANLITEDLVDLLVQMGVVEVALGLESMSPRILSFLKDKVTVEQNVSAVEILHKAGLRVGGLFMIGTPGETIEDLEFTYHYIKANRSKFGGMTLCITTPLPGTPLWDICIKMGRIESDILKINFDKFILSPPECNKNIYVGDIEWDTFVKIHELFMKLFYAPHVPLPQSLLVDISRIKDNFIMAGVNEIETVRGNYASEKWPEGIIFWSNGLVELEAYLRSQGEDNRFSMNYKTLFRLNPNIMFKINLKIINFNTNSLLLEREIDPLPGLWQKNEFDLEPMKSKELIKVLIKTDSICLKDQNISDDFRNLGIAIQEIRLKSNENC